MKKVENIYYTDSTNPRHLLDIYLPDTETFPVLIYFHGGGIESGSKNDYTTLCTELAERGIAAVAANYRLYPEAKYPDYLNDAASAVAWVYHNMCQYGNVTGYYVGGSSAGGYITQMLCFDKKYLSERSVDPDKLSGYIMDAGQPTVHFNVLRERGMDTRRVIIDEAAPLYHICEERNYPPMYIIVSDNDMQNRYEQTLLLISTLKHFGHEENITLDVRENSTHCSYVFKSDENGKNLLGNMIYKYISERSGTK